MAWKLGDPLVYNPTAKPVAATTPKPVTGVVPPTTQLNPYTNGPNAVVGSGGGAASAIPKAATTPVASISPVTKGVIPPAYGANVAGFDPSNANQTALADAGTAWWTAKKAGDTAGMTAAAAKGADLRAQGGIPASFDSKTGITTFTPQQAEEKVAATPLPSGGYTPPDYMSIANGENAYELARQNTRATEEKASLTSAYDRANQIQKDNRVLGDVTRTQSVSPFANMGKRAFDEGLIGRERTLQDEQAEGTYNAGIKGIDQGLTDFENTAAQEARARAYALEQDAKNYDLQYAQTYGKGQNGGPETLAATSQNITNQGNMLSNQLSQLQLDAYPEQSKQQAILVQQQLNAGSINNQTAQYQLNELKNPNSVTNQAAALDLKMKQLEASALPETQKLQLQQLRKSIANIGKTAPTSDYDKQMQDLNLKKANLEYDNLLSKSRNPPKSELTPKESTSTYNDIYDDLLSGATKAEARELLSRNSANLVDSDYKKLNDYINENL